ncbi:hypothetical protein [Ruminococcus callidus]|uniref:hypothetical protein n=1 Tax=Ruminococcus callidus TaxID=40519 RepID=UPI003522F2B3
MEQNRCFRNENGIPERAAFRFFAADSCFICGDPHGVSERLSAASPKNFYFFVLRPAARFAENAFFGSAFSTKAGLFSLLRRRQYSGNGSSVPQKKHTAVRFAM